MEFEFLPNLPKSDLDDRAFKDLVDECILRIPRYCPEWTNYNPSDPGITLIELFAWLTDQMLLRFNQIPRRNYVAFLELLGIRLSPPTPAQTAVTFYLTRPQRSEDPFQPIPRWTEVATERTETDEAIVFSTNEPLAIGIPHIHHFLTCEQAHGKLNETVVQRWIDAAADLRDRQERQRRVQLRDRFSNNWRQDNQGRWTGREQPVFQLQPEAGNCFYLVFSPDQPLDGNVISLAIEGEPAGPTGIDPRRPPRRWEAWDGHRWHDILLKESDDGTLGFSFDEGGQAVLSAVREADVRLHLPLDWPSTRFFGYSGRWLRCVCSEPVQGQSGYRATPLFSGLSARSLGGSVMASQCSVIRNELLGESNGKPGQVFELQAKNILQRDRSEEHVVIALPDGSSQDWQEVSDFADSGPEDRHYTLDSITGRIQFGPLIREPSQLRDEVSLRHAVQTQGLTPTDAEIQALESQERQCGAVPPRGAVVRMKAYRSGGGNSGNVKQERLRKLKSAVPYVKQVVNYAPAQGGADAESLDEAVLRVPRMLRTQNRAVTSEDFETLTLQASRQVARAHCPRQQEHQPGPGIVQVFVVPKILSRSLPTYSFEATLPESVDRSSNPGSTSSSASNPTAGNATTLSLTPTLAQGDPPEAFSLTPDLRAQVQSFLDERRLLGIEVRLAEPVYTGVAVQAEVSLAPNFRARPAEVRRRLLQRLYDFLHPVTGGKTGQGWPFGQPLYKSDVMALFQQFPEVAYLEALDLFVLEPMEMGDRLTPSGDSTRWQRRLVMEGVIDPGPLGTLCSWSSQSNGQTSGQQGRSGHVIRFVEERTA